MQYQRLSFGVIMLLTERMRVHQHHAVHNMHVGKHNDACLIRHKETQQKESWQMDVFLQFMLHSQSLLYKYIICFG